MIIGVFVVLRSGAEEFGATANEGMSLAVAGCIVAVAVLVVDRLTRHSRP